jgi:signal transduction histidine kinase/ActR/RegA family two-component response regulator
MPVTHYHSDKFNELRNQAEKLIQQQPEFESDIPADILELIHELRIHQAELEIQNEELKRAQQEISDLHSDLYQKYQNIYEFAPCGYLTINKKGIINRINLTAIRLLDTHRKFVLLKSFSQFLEEGWDEVYWSACAKCAQTGEKQSIDIPIKKENGPPLWTRADIEADRDDNGAVVQWRMVLIDITEYLKAIEEKEKAQAQLHQHQKMESIGNLAGGIAHDFNNLLASVIGFTELALGDVDSGTNLEGNLQEVLIASKRAKDLVARILAFARQTNEEVKPVQIRLIAKECLKLLRSSLPTTIEIKQEFNSEAAVLGNPTLLQQSLMNLATNAMHAMEENGGILTVKLSDVDLDAEQAKKHHLPKPGSYVKITVSDTGIGIPENAIQSVFEPYFTTKEPGKGTGMGLALVHGTIKKYGGTALVDSSPGQGTNFTILLPIINKLDTETTYQSAELPQGTEHILFVDDELAIAKMGRQLLERWGYDVTSRTSSIEALEFFRTKPHDFDLIITDMTMPNLTGDKLAVELIKIRRDIPIILCTGYSKKISEERASEIGIKAFVYKPFVTADFAKTVRKILDGDPRTIR